MYLFYLFVLCPFQYYIALVVIFLVLVAGSVMAFAFKDQIIAALTNELKDTVITKYHDDPELQGIVDWFQEEVGAHTLHSLG